MEHITSNFVESFNAVTGAARYKPPITLLETIRIKIMDIIYTRKMIAERWTKSLTPRVFFRVKKKAQLARHAEVRRCWNYEFQVEFNAVRVGVRLEDSHCDCRGWELICMPHVYAMACINVIRANVQDYVCPCFTIEARRRCVGSTVHPIPSKSLWLYLPQDDLLQALMAKRLPGRPKKHRNRQQDEARPVTARSSNVTCQLCKNKGHNMRSYPENHSKRKRKDNSKGSKVSKTAKPSKFESGATSGVGGVGPSSITRSRPLTRSSKLRD